MRDQVTIPGRFNGPPGTANGGYACGLLAAAIGPSASVRLLHPPPLDVPLERRRDDDGVLRLYAGETPIAEGRAGSPAVEVPAPPSVADAARAAERYAGHEAAPVPDVLRLRPGPPGRPAHLPRDRSDTTACSPACGAQAPQTARFVWAALDCPSGFACMPPGTRTVLASMTASLEAPIEPERDYIVTAWPIASEGRKHRAGSAIHDADGRRIAFAEALWITLRDA